MSQRPEGIGIDLLQYRARVATAVGGAWPPAVEHAPMPDRPAVALLPMHERETPIFGPHACDHRRGVGLAWPPEAQAPKAGDPARGVGRVPLVCCWASLLPAEATGEGWGSSLADVTFAWSPDGEDRPVAVSAGRLIAGSAVAWAASSEAPRALVVPDALGEAAQQAILDEVRQFDLSEFLLLPRPIALALAWCRQNEARSEGDWSEDEEGTAIGHLRVSALGFDGWELSLIEIRARRYQGRVWLVPVRNRPETGVELPIWGVTLLANLAAEGARDATEAWSRVFGQDWLSQVLAKQRTDRGVRAGVQQGLIHGWLRRTRELFDRWPALASAMRMSPGLKNLRTTIDALVSSQLARLGDDSKRQLGTVVDGDLTPLILDEQISLGQKVAEILGGPTGGTLISHGKLATEGAALAAVALHRGLPCYRETLVPIDIHTHGKDSHGDPVTRYMPLVEARTVEAGREYRPAEPITGLKIRDGARKLELTLRRPTPAGFTFRKITDNLPKPAVREEPVRIRVAIQPGQGFARARVESEREGVFSTVLDWKRMELVTEPPPPRLSYLPGVSVIVPDSGMWHEAEDEITAASVSLETSPLLALDRLRVVTKLMNRWPLADRVDDYRRVSRGKDNPFRHYGTIGSDGDINAVKNPRLLKRFQAALAKRFDLEDGDGKLADQILRTGGWLYLAIPSNMTERLRDRLSGPVTAIKSVDLHAVGLTWSQPTDLRVFFAALARRISNGDGRPNNHWLRAIRNIVRFREHALADDSLPWAGGTREKSDQLQGTVVEATRAIMSDELHAREPRLKMKFNNCLLALLYILKRRRYDQAFLAHQNKYRLEFEKMLTLANRLGISDHQSVLIETTLKFLKGEATSDDASRFLGSGDDDDDE